MGGFKILSMTLHRDPHITATGIACVAALDVQIGPVALLDCTLARYDSGDFDLWPPRARSSRKTSAITIEKGARKEIREAAVAAYRALGGDVMAEG
ncbi:hypothetical protein [Wenxinia marina]|uniref:Uncharacterized protein n=1 Tax=Wenxinia marina DSM 24838 TaxID=1123501 RepID=A0A0D0PHE4_9RHOB|nr:hypothetical protein [Wenxinia marina]KIQ70756.1 hypothetical protein Wenmar_00640 [Wenxinia marina DSM 24838]GGL80390.1 hypothetical protein GCM10011392_38740 [Wenxinia marina]